MAGLDLLVECKIFSCMNLTIPESLKLDQNMAGAFSCTEKLTFGEL